MLYPIFLIHVLKSLRTKIMIWPTKGNQSLPCFRKFRCVELDQNSIGMQAQTMRVATDANTFEMKNCLNNNCSSVLKISAQSVDSNTFEMKNCLNNSCSSVLKILAQTQVISAYALGGGQSLLLVINPPRWAKTSFKILKKKLFCF